MPLAAIADVEGLLRCPKCRGALVLDPKPHCLACAQDFPRVMDQPILIDFEHSIFGPDDFNREPQPASKGSGIGRFLDRLTYGKSRATIDNFHRFVRALSGPLVLVIGGGTRGGGTEPLYEGAEVVGTDVYASANTILVCDGHSLPFADASFDGVVIQAVLEHVLDPGGVVAEIHRVLKPGGIVYAETPFMQQVHEGAYDFTRFTHSGHRWLFRRFAEIDSGLGAGPGVGLLWAIRYWLRGLGAPSSVQALLTAPFFWVRLLDRFARRDMALDAASGVFFLGARAEGEIGESEMVGYYRTRDAVSRIAPAGEAESRS